MVLVDLCEDHQNPKYHVAESSEDESGTSDPDMTHESSKSSTAATTGSTSASMSSMSSASESDGESNRPIASESSTAATTGSTSASMSSTSSASESDGESDRIIARRGPEEVQQELSVVQCALAEHLQQGGDKTRAAALYREAAKNGCMDSACHLGFLLFHGDGVAVDLEAAREQFARAAEASHVVSLRNLGVMYLRGIGVARDVNAGFEYLCRAASLGHPVAQHHVGTLLIWGSPPEITADLDAGEEFLAKAAEQGHQPSINNLKLTAKLREIAHWKKDRFVPRCDKHPPTALQSLFLSASLRRRAATHGIEHTKWAPDYAAFGALAARLA